MFRLKKDRWTLIFQVVFGSGIQRDQIQTKDSIFSGALGLDPTFSGPGSGLMTILIRISVFKSAQ